MPQRTPDQDLRFGGGIIVQNCPQLNGISVGGTRKASDFEKPPLMTPENCQLINNLLEGPVEIANPRAWTIRGNNWPDGVPPGVKEAETVYGNPTG